MKTNLYAPPIYRLDKINHYIKAKLDDYLRDSIELSKGAFEKTIFMRMFFENELEEAKKLLSEVGQPNRTTDLNPYSMSLARSGYGYPTDRESIHQEKEFFKFYIISLEKHLKTLADSLDKKQPKAINLNSTEQTEPALFVFKNKFDHVVPKKVYDYFKKELVDTNYLSLVDLQKYLVVAFQDMTVPKEKFTFEKKTNVKTARDIFYRYYTVTAAAGNNKKMIYAELLGNYFTGHTSQKVFNNFAK